MHDGLVISISDTTLKEIDYITNTIVEKYRAEVTDVAALAWTLQTLLTAKAELEKDMEEYEEEIDE